jgi:hypothetical protein
MFPAGAEQISEKLSDDTLTSVLGSHKQGLTLGVTEKVLAT